MKKLKMVATAICMLSIFGLLLLPHGASAQTTGRLAAPGFAPLAQSTPEAGMMEQKPGETMTGDQGTMTGETMNGESMSTQGTMEKPADTMTSKGGDAMMESSLPKTGSGDSAWLLWLTAASTILFLMGLRVRKLALARVKK